MVLGLICCPASNLKVTGRQISLHETKDFLITGSVKCCSWLPPEGRVINVDVVWETELKPLISFLNLKLEGNEFGF